MHARAEDNAECKPHRTLEPQASRQGPAQALFCHSTRAVALGQAPLSTQGVVSITVSWELHEEYEEESEAAQGGEDVLEGLFGAPDGDAEFDPEYDGEGKGSPAKKKHWLQGYGGSAKALSADGKAGPKPPDMLSLSIAISILVKFCLFDLVGFFQVRVRARAKG